ncbi:hypothetical protein [Chthonobacter rhizosphaerae]|uniref:hypothetical protein n=1 Tax=Chthonobacter rhizosphaerae TaxID=2735553 RepID=UPI001AEF1B5B|nr:hypothetical protein [Chthonobacter rhizosphaerae]
MHTLAQFQKLERKPIVVTPAKAIRPNSALSAVFMLRKIIAVSDLLKVPDFPGFGCQRHHCSGGELVEGVHHEGCIVPLDHRRRRVMDSGYQSDGQSGAKAAYD